MHDYDKPSEDFIRWMIHYPRSREERTITAPYGVGGHADFSSLTLLFEQNVLGLQVLTRGGDWQWVKPVKGGITVNAGESLQHITKGIIPRIEKGCNGRLRQSDYPPRCSPAGRPTRLRTSRMHLLLQRRRTPLNTSQLT
jgi:2OG-Fe(II) oxygenase superfamily